MKITKIYQYWLLSFLISANLLLIAQPKYLYFDFTNDSLKTRNIKCTAPANLQSFSVNNSLVTDYIGNTRISLITGVITGKKDTVLALHSLVNGAGNVVLETETPIWITLVRKQSKRDFIGTSFHPRISTIISSSNTFETSMLSMDLGWNITGQFSGDLGNIVLKYTLRNAYCTGNNQFVRKAFDFHEPSFIYTSIQIKLKAGANILSFNYPIYIYSMEDKYISGLPVYAGYALLF